MFRGHEVGFCLGVHTAIPDVWLMGAFTRRRRLGSRFVPLATVDELFGPWLFSECRQAFSAIGGKDKRGSRSIGRIHMGAASSQDWALCRRDTDKK